MRKADLDDYLSQGIHGQKETKPEERRRFLGTLRERVVVALTKVQVKKKGIYQEVKEQIRLNKDAHLYLNGNLDYSHLSKYIQIAKEVEMEFTMVANQEHDTELGLVLAYDHAIDKEDIFVKDKKEYNHKPVKKQKGVTSLLGKIFNKK